MKKSPDDSENKIRNVRQRVKEGYYCTESVAELIAEKFLEHADWATKTLTFKYD